MSELKLPMPDWWADVDLTSPLPTDEQAMAKAIELSRLNVEHGSGGPFGAVVVDAADGRIVAGGVNLVRSLEASCLHAEVVAITRAQQALRSFSLADRPRILYTSCAPCAMCLGAVHWSGCARLVCGAARADAEAVGFDEGPVFDDSYAYLERNGIAVVHGVLRDQAAAVLRDYAKRDGAIYNGRETEPTAA